MSREFVLTVYIFFFFLDGYQNFLFHLVVVFTSHAMACGRRASVVPRVCVASTRLCMRRRQWSYRANAEHLASGIIQYMGRRNVFFSLVAIVFAVWIDRSFFSYLFCRSSVVFVYVAGVLRENWVTSSSLVVFLFFFCFCFHSHTKLGLTEFQLFFWCGILCMFQGYLGFFTSGTADGGSENMFFECISNYNIQLVLAFDLTNVLNLNTKMTKNVNFHANKIYRIGIQSDQTYKQSQAIYRQNEKMKLFECVWSVHSIACHQTITQKTALIHPDIQI